MIRPNKVRLERKAIADQRRALGLAVPGRKPRALEDKPKQDEPMELQAPPAQPAQQEPMAVEGADRKKKRDEQDFIEETYAKQDEAASKLVPDIDEDLEPSSKPREKKRKLQQPDDLPLSIKSKIMGQPPPVGKTVRFQDQQQGIGQVPVIALACAVNNKKKQDDWLKPCEKDNLSKLLGVKVLAAKAHGIARRKLFKTTIPRQDVRRLTVMIDENQQTKLSDDDGLSSKKLPGEWKGATIFYIAQEDHNHKEVCFLDTPAGLVPFWMSKEEMEDVQYIYNTHGRTCTR